METIVTTQVLDELSTFIDIAKRDPKAEVECKLLAGKIQTKDVADRILKSIQTISVGAMCEEHRLTIAYADGTRVVVNGTQNIHKLCSNKSIAIDKLIIAASRLPILGSGVLMGAPIGGMDGSEITLFSSAGNAGAPFGLALSR
jgi:hypothetical protein